MPAKIHSPLAFSPAPGVASWFALRVRTRSELVVAEMLDAKGIRGYVPISKVPSKWKDRTKILLKPIFPGYVFSRFPLSDRLPVLTTPHVTQIVGLGHTPTPIPDEEMDHLFVLGSADLPKCSVDMPSAGERVLIKEGPLAGVEGVLVRARRSRLLVNVTLLRRAVSVEVEQSWVISADPVNSPLQSSDIESFLGKVEAA